jgi:hypothetical protein
VIAFVCVKNPDSVFRTFLDIGLTPSKGDYLRVNRQLCRISHVIVPTVQLLYDEFHEDFIESAALEYRLEIWCSPVGAAVVVPITQEMEVRR